MSQEQFDTNLQYDPDESSECPDCDGSGEVSAPLTQIVCDIETCKTCKGTGFV